MNRFAESYRFILLLSLSVITVNALEINTDGQKGVVRTLSAMTSGKGTLNIGSGFTFAQSADYFSGPVIDGTGSSVIDPDGNAIDESQVETARLFSSNIFLAVNPASFLNLSLSLPYYYDWSGITNVNDGGLGDLRLSAKLVTPSAAKGFYQGYFISGTIPVGMQKNGIFPRHSYYVENEHGESSSSSFYSAKAATLTAELLLTLDVSAFKPKLPLQFHINIGGTATSSRSNQRNLMLGNIAVEYNPAYFFTMFLDLSGEIRFGNLSTDLKTADDPIVLTPGIKIKTPNGLYLLLAGDFALSSRKASSRVNHNPTSGKAAGYSYSTGVIPSYGAQFILGWNGFITVQDDDRDGIKNNIDRCPKDAEDKDGFEDSDGCPDPDNDHDGIADIIDKCPNEIEDRDGFQDDDGCPDLDNDSDSIVDIKDKCPNFPEDIDGFEDSDGCIDNDNDMDAIIDSKDSCPDEKEDIDGFQDNDGCPDPDNDSDGIADTLDKCPNLPETFNGLNDNDGCPDTVRKESTLPQQQILQGLQFRNNGPELTFNSYQYIEPIIRQLKQFPEIEIEVRGHTDTLGDYSKNMKLSQMRSEAVRQYLISKGVDSKRIRAVGFGATIPVADNRTASGRSQNRRIEIVRVK